MMVRKLLPLLAVATVAAASSPASAIGQISSCWLCDDPGLFMNLRVKGKVGG